MNSKNLPKHIEELGGRIAGARTKAITTTVLVCIVAGLLGVSMVNLVLQWKLQPLMALDEQPTPTSQQWILLLTPPGLFVLMVLVSVYCLVQWIQWQGLRTERNVLELLADENTEPPPAAPEDS